jgi:hypothetical protein
MTATGYPREEVLQDEVPVSVNPALTVLVGPVAGGVGALQGYIENVTGSGQTLEVRAQTRWSEGSQWVNNAAINYAQFDTAIADGDRQDFYIDMTQVRELRIIGLASGAGLDALVCSRKIIMGLVR